MLNNSCVECDAQCATCAVSAKNCLKCDVAGKVFDPTTNTCVSSCSEYLDLDPKQNLCVKMNTFQYTVNSAVKVANPV